MADASVTITDAVDAPSVQSQYLTAQGMVTNAQNRLNVLREKSLQGGLEYDEELEQLALERRMSNLAPKVQALQRQVSLQQDVVDIARVQEAWGAVVSEKQRAYAAFLAALAQLRAAFDGIWAVHGKQEQLIGQLPVAIQQRLEFPTAGLLQTRMSGRLPDGRAWAEIFGPPVPFAMPRLEDLMDVDPGTKQINSDVIRRFLEEGAREQERRNAERRR